MEEKMFCKNCGQLIQGDCKFCANCGTEIVNQNRVSVNPETENQKMNEDKVVKVIEMLDKLPNKPSLRGRVMLGFFVVAIIMILMEGISSAIAFGVAGCLLTKKVYNTFPEKRVYLIIGVIVCFIIGIALAPEL